MKVDTKLLHLYVIVDVYALQRSLPNRDVVAKQHEMHRTKIKMARCGTAALHSQK